MPGRPVLRPGRGKTPRVCAKRARVVGSLPTAARRERHPRGAARATFVAVALLMLTPSACRRLALRSDPLATGYPERLSRDAFQRAEARLRNLVPGAPVDRQAIGFEYFGVPSIGDPETPLLAAADGWIPSMSGGTEGAQNGLGSTFGRDAEHLYGEHVFGYTWNLNLVPKLRLVTRATLIDESPLKPLTPEDDRRVGVIRLAGQPAPLHFADVVVVRLEGLPFEEPTWFDPSGVQTSGGPAAADEALAKLGSEESYLQVADALAKLSPGTPLWDLVHELGGLYLDQGSGYTLLLKGFLHYSETAPWVTTTRTACYEVWTFGHLVDETPVPKTSVIFRNHELLAVRPYATRGAIEAMLND